jgi:hypothetical protein
MPRTEKVLVVFVASPSDLEEERGRLEDHIRELNLTWSKTFGVRLELVRWETHAFPGAGVDAQDVINRELGDDHDLFIGMMWGRFGSPTGRAESGTEEEFLRAKARFDADPSALQIMFYFKDAPLPPSKIDPEQLAKVQSFRESLGEEGLLHWSFATPEEFDQLLRLHLARYIQSQQVASSTQAFDSVPAGAPAASSPKDEDEGILDLMDLFDEKTSSANEIGLRISRATRELIDRMKARATAINQAVAATNAAQQPLPRSDAKRLINDAASDMQLYVASTDAEIPLFRSALQEGIGALTKAATMFSDLGPQDTQQLSDRRKGTAQLESGFASAHASFMQFRSSVDSLPRMTTTLNRAKRETVRVIDAFLSALDEGRRNSAEASKLFDSMIERR